MSAQPDEIEPIRSRGALPSRTRGGGPAQERKLRSQGKETLRRLLDAGMEVFDKRGYHAARVDDIVKVAQTSHGTFYLYFSNKEDLFWALLADVTSEMESLSEALGEVGTGVRGYQELRHWLSRFYGLYARYAPVIRAWTESEVDNSELGNVGSDLLGRFALRLTARIRELALGPHVDPQIAALAMVAMIERFGYYVQTRSIGVDNEAMLDTLATILHLGVFGGRAPRRRPSAG